MIYLKGNPLSIISRRKLPIQLLRHNIPDCILQFFIKVTLPAVRLGSPCDNLVLFFIVSPITNMSFLCKAVVSVNGASRHILCFCRIIGKKIAEMIVFLCSIGKPVPGFPGTYKGSFPGCRSVISGRNTACHPRQHQIASLILSDHPACCPASIAPYGAAYIGIIKVCLVGSSGDSSYIALSPNPIGIPVLGSDPIIHQPCILYIPCNSAYIGVSPFRIKYNAFRTAVFDRYPSFGSSHLPGDSSCISLGINITGDCYPIDHGIPQNSACQYCRIILSHNIFCLYGQIFHSSAVNHPKKPDIGKRQRWPNNLQP